MRLQVRRVSKGPGPGEIVIEIDTASGKSEQVILHNADIEEGDTIDIGYPIHRTNGKFLVELPRESISGRWRIWVPNGSVAAA